MWHEGERRGAAGARHDRRGGATHEDRGGARAATIPVSPHRAAARLVGPSAVPASWTARHPGTDRYCR